jgi:hypothetical protein
MSHSLSVSFINAYIQNSYKCEHLYVFALLIDVHDYSFAN